MPTVTLTTENFESIISDHDIVLVDFWASWCGPCRTFAPVFEKAAEANSDIVFAKVDTEAQQQLAAMFGITSIPTIAAFREKVLVYAEAGALPSPAFDQLINAVRSMDMADVHRQVAESKASVDKGSEVTTS